MIQEMPYLSIFLSCNLGLTLVVGEKLLPYLLRGGSKLPKQEQMGLVRP